MKKNILLFSFILLVCAVSAQPWSNTIVANPSSLNVGSPTITSNTKDVSLIKQAPDAVTSNTNNSNSEYPIRTLFSITNIQPKVMSYTIFDESCWLNIIDENGQLIKSKGLTVSQIPNTSTDFVISISSLKYDDKDVLVFTGELVEYGLISHQNNAVSYVRINNTMIVGTYDLKTDDVKIKYLDHPHKTNYSVNDVPTTSYINSYGIGVEYISDNYNINNYYSAVGATMHYKNTSTKSEHPIVFVFDVQIDGTIIIKKINYFNFKFTPTSTTTDVNGNIVAAGIYEPSYNVNLSNIPSCTGYSQAQSGLGVFVIKYSTINTISLVEYNVSYMPSFDLSFNHLPIPRPRIFRSITNEFYVAFNDDNNPGAISHPTIGVIDQSLTSNSFYRIDVEPTSSSVEAFSGAFTDKDGSIELSFAMQDNSNYFGKDNDGTIGVIKFDKANLSSSPIPIKQVYSSDDQNHNIRSFNNVTSIGQFAPDYRGNQNIHTYYFADGLKKGTDGSRLHVFGIKDSDFDALCSDDWTAGIQPVSCLLTEHMNTFPDLMYNLNQTVKEVNNQWFPGTINSESISSDPVNGITFNCIDFDTKVAQFRKVPIIEEVNTIEEITVYPNPSTGIFNLKFESEKYDIIVVKNVLGETIKEFRLSDLASKAQLNLSDYPKGMYMVSLIGTKTIETIKITKQ